MRQHTVWQKISRSVVVLSIFVMACTQSANTPVAQNGAAVMPTRAPAKVSDEQFTVAQKQVLTQQLTTEQVNEFSLEQQADLLETIGRANPSSMFHNHVKLLFLRLKEANANPIAPDYTGLDEVQTLNAKLLYASAERLTQGILDVVTKMEHTRLSSHDVENIDGNLLFWLIMNYLEKHPEQRQAMKNVTKLPDESAKAFNERKWDAFGAIAGDNLRLLNRYMEYYSERGWWRFTR